MIPLILWNSGSTEAETLVLAVFLITSFFLTWIWDCLFLNADHTNAKSQITEEQRSLTPLQQLDALERAAEKLNTPDTFVQYAKLKRDLAKRRRALEENEQARQHSAAAYPGAMNTNLGHGPVTNNQKCDDSSAHTEFWTLFRRTAKTICRHRAMPVILVFFLFRLSSTSPSARYLNWKKAITASIVSQVALKRLRTYLATLRPKSPASATSASSVQEVTEQAPSSSRS